MKYKCLKTGGVGEYEEKKSRFIATLRPVNSEAEATAFIAEMKKKYWDAKHNCSAFVIGMNGEITRCSDDGEPSGTAGRPMLEVLIGAEVKNVCVVVTRYFGGVLLGTGGLVRAYSSAVKEGLANSEIVTIVESTGVDVTVAYTEVGKLQHFFTSEMIDVSDCVYAENVTFTISVPNEDVDATLKKITDLTGGKAELQKRE